MQIVTNGRLKKPRLAKEGYLVRHRLQLAAFYKVIDFSPSSAPSIQLYQTSYDLSLHLAQLVI